MFKNIKNIYKSTVLCIKYPFLYPRNRYTERHYNNWGLCAKITEYYNKGFNFGTKKNGFKTTVKNYWYAFLYKVLKLWHNNVLQVFHCIPVYTEWDLMETGWKTAFGDSLLKELKEAMLEDGGRKYLHDVRILDIKEKYGTLRIYLNNYGEKTMNVINKYENISWHTCIKCGKPAVGYTTGWISPYCEDCKNEIINKGKGFEYFKDGEND